MFALSVAPYLYKKCKHTTLELQKSSKRTDLISKHQKIIVRRIASDVDVDVKLKMLLVCCALV